MTYGVIVPRFMNLNYNLINKFDTTLELKDVHTKGNMFLSSRPTNLINYDLTNAKCNENYIITNCTFILIPQECIIHDYIVMFHMHNELQQLLFWGKLSQLLCMGLNGGDHWCYYLIKL
jgi:hypothetical protein